MDTSASWHEWALASMKAVGPAFLLSNGTIANSPARRTLGSVEGIKAQAVCVDYTVDGYYATGGSQSLTDGLPSSAFIDRPPTLSSCELERLHSDCIERLNLYRAGALKFSDGTEDSNVAAGLDPLDESTGANECSSEQALGDLNYNVNNENEGGCAGAHYTAFSCPSGGAAAQNSCCARGGGAFGDGTEIVTYDLVKEYLFAAAAARGNSSAPAAVAVPSAASRSLSEHGLQDRPALALSARVVQWRPGQA